MATLHVLNDVVFNDNDNSVTRSTSISDPPPSDPTIILALEAGGLVEARDGDDTIQAVGGIFVNAAVVNLDIVGFDIKDSTILMGRGSDALLGLYELTVEPGFGALSAIGLSADNSSIELGQGADRILGLVESTGLVLNLGGIVGLDASLGQGSDLVLGAVSRTDTNPDVFGGIQGLAQFDIRTGTGDDAIAGRAFATVGNNATLSTFGIAAGSVDFDENDAGGAAQTGLLTGVTSLTAGDDAGVFSFGIGGVAVDGGSGRDQMIGIAIATLGMGAKIVELGGIKSLADDTIILNGGADVVLGMAQLTAGANALAEQGFLEANPNIFGIEAFIDSGAGADLIYGLAEANLTTGASIDAIEGIRGSAIKSGNGEDVIIGLSDVDVFSGLKVQSYGISASRIETGDHNDTIIGVSLLFGTTGAQESIGIHNTLFDLGDGDDFMFARGDDKGFAGGLVIGGAGDDVFDLQSGSGSVDGGADNDTLILDGALADFTLAITTDGANVLIELEHIATSDSFFTVNIETYVLDGTSYSADDLLAL